MEIHDSGKSFEIIGWRQQQQHKYLVLAQVAFDAFSIPLNRAISECIYPEKGMQSRLQCQDLH